MLAALLNTNHESVLDSTLLNMLRDNMNRCDSVWQARFLNAVKPPYPSPSTLLYEPQFADPFGADLEYFTQAFCGTASPKEASIASTTGAHLVSSTSSPSSTAVAQKDYAKSKACKWRAPRGRLTSADAIVIFKLRQHKTPQTAVVVADADWRINFQLIFTRTQISELIFINFHSHADQRINFH